MNRPTPKLGARVSTWGAWLLLVLSVLLVGVFVVAAFWFRASPPLLWMGLWIALSLGILASAVRYGPLSGLGLVIVATVGFSLWWMTILPSNDRDWQPDVSQLLTAEFDPNDPSRVTLRNVRNFDWQTPTEAAERWEARDYDLDALESLDFVMTWWAGPAIAHTMVSFGFSDGEHIVFSLGIRPERNEAYSSIAGFFKSYELILTGADERDAVQLRTSVQTGNRVVLYRLHGDPAVMRGLFLEYLALANSLAEHPRFYRTILDNCTTVIWKLADRLVPGLPIDYRVVLSGYLPEFLYDHGLLDQRFPLEKLTEMGLLPASISYDGSGRGFSSAIRAKLLAQ
ncbi:DUF4105 domain-containing protein [Tabrizicola sp. BL-A-41-H6]|uniref:Lnb N-terminal periplasmic domain-containing protein n=1 Tax=Tabrizicola sp. BL-A-41-H6 TaxID=3421107 RepID=UPI003D67E4FE